MIERGNFQSNKEFLKPFLGELRKSKVLEIGCGNGSMTGHLKALGVDILGIDMNERYIKNAKSRFGKENFKLMRGEDLKLMDDSFDIVLSFDLLEHIPDISKHLKEVRRVLKKDGRYLLQTPNRYTSIPFSIYKDRSFTKWKEYHPSLQTKTSLKKKFKEIGFNVEFINVDIYTKYFRNKLPKILRWIDPQKLGVVTNFYVIAKKED
jgi:2-polyprenyl-3-methyl-5-hydroxy-6-metoxy-1,4-benzoquinol methylase